MSSIFSRYVALSEELESYGEHMVFLYLDTPIGLCIERIEHRRWQAGNTKPLNPSNTIRKHENTHECYTKMEKAGLDARWMHHNSDAAVAQLLVLLDGWPFLNSYKEQSFR
jgi:predicted kinase